MKKVIATTKAPGAIGPYSQAIDTGTFVYASGQIPIDPATGNRGYRGTERTGHAQRRGHSRRGRLDYCQRCQDNRIPL